MTKVQTTENRVPLADGTADRVFLLNVLHHIWDEPAALGEILRLLAPGGRLVVVDFAQMDRPVGPPNDHVLSLDRRAPRVAGMGLRELVRARSPATSAATRSRSSPRSRRAAARTEAGSAARLRGATPMTAPASSLVSHVRAAHGPDLAGVGRAPRRALRRLGGDRQARRPCRGQGQPAPRRRRPSAPCRRTPRRCAASCARFATAGRGAVRRRQPGRAQRPRQGRARLPPQRHRRRVRRRGRPDRRHRGREDDRGGSARAGCTARSRSARRSSSADVMVQVGVLKTHQLMRLTGASS